MVLTSQPQQAKMHRTACARHSKVIRKTRDGLFCQVPIRLDDSLLPCWIVQVFEQFHEVNDILNAITGEDRCNVQAVPPKHGQLERCSKGDSSRNHHGTVIMRPVILDGLPTPRPKPTIIASPSNIMNDIGSSSHRALSHQQKNIVRHTGQQSSIYAH